MIVVKNYEQNQLSQIPITFFSRCPAVLKSFIFSIFFIQEPMKLSTSFILYAPVAPCYWYLHNTYKYYCNVVGMLYWEKKNW
jgi:hypothetical protein